jgi:hypothetical protein
MSIYDTHYADDEDGYVGDDDDDDLMNNSDAEPWLHSRERRVSSRPRR